MRLCLVNTQLARECGDDSLAYGQILVELGGLEAAKAHLQQHLKTWSHPQSYITAKIQQKQGNRLTLVKPWKR
ncbi:hypothetical protein H6F43_11300 [Leptolyngbya sp. FACHB-36]|uniref:hypothetical protein n=1 Tax=Leptolyngbya sp. FACHB-36 TaxID=2692808 RepID=UPI001680360F|nr:hypothetical protein [Leptolyngbya sp. FACHB-36]MBD2020768.1 hypothetical protein [Leptolyngbya sp. FACHB-36]